MSEYSLAGLFLRSSFRFVSSSTAFISLFYSLQSLPSLAVICESLRMFLRELILFIVDLNLHIGLFEKNVLHTNGASVLGSCIHDNTSGILFEVHATDSTSRL